MLPRTVILTAVPDLALVRPGDDLAALIIAAIDRADLAPQEKDVLVVAQKVVSKAEGRYVVLDDVIPSPRARELAQAVDKDSRLVEVILSESQEVVGYRRGVLVVAHRLGFVLANAGIDRSNLEPDGGSERVLLLPEDPNASAAALRTRLEARYRIEMGVVVNDSAGRAWRNGSVGITLGAAGLPPLRVMAGQRDLYGRRLEVTEVGLADEVAAAASLLMGQAGEGLPLVLVSGLDWQAGAADARVLLRPKEEDLFR